MKTNDEVFDSNGNLVYSYEDLEMGLRELSKEIPVTSVELAEFAEIAGRLQIPTDEVVEFTEVVAKLGETTNLSGEEAAEQLGKFINITGASTSSTLNLANALVELGNNTAASEQETLRMSTRWASTGNIIGMSDDQILALSASVISLGIRTEAGGSAVQRSFLKINDAVLGGGDVLADFAKTAGMSSEDFKKAWQDDAAQALIPFLKGLNDTHEAGGNVNGILKDLGISSVNELNTLLVLAGGYDQLAGNLDLASKAYNETEESMMALNKEAELAYGTTLGKLRTAWNRLKDSLIDIGEPIANALIDMVAAAEPLFEIVENLAKSFSNLDETAQRDLLKTVATIALIAPALKIAGGAMTTTGDIFKVGGAVTRKAGELITKAMFGVAGEAATLTTVSGTAAGSKGVGGLIASLAGSAGLPWALGIAAAALGGWTLWKLWGEDVWEAGQRTKRWGTDVGEAVDEALSSVSDASAIATGQFGLMEQGLAVDSAAMIENFENMGLVIENSLVERISMLDGLIEGLPSTLSDTLGKVLTEDKKMLEENLEIVQAHNERITEIREKAANNNRDISVLEAKQIQESTTKAAEAYVKTLGLTQEEQKTILDAMTGDVENATKEQATAMVQTLGEQRKVLEDQRREERKSIEKELKETGLYSEARVEELVAMWDKGNEATTDGIDQQLRIIAEKYPEIAEEILFSTGQVISGNEIYVDSAIKANQKIIDSAIDLSAQVAANAQRNADAIAWQVHGTRDFEKAWSDIVLDDKTGKIKTNVREAIVEAGSNNEQWNNMKFMLHNADLDSNAKKMIGEATIVNGYWEGMPWSQKELVIEDEFSINVFKALEDTGKWNELSVEEKTALLYSNTPEIMAQTMFDLGLWDEYQAEIKSLGADNYGILKAISESESAMEAYNKAPVELKTLFAEDPATMTFNDSRKALEAFNRLDPELKDLLGRNDVAMSKIKEVENRIKYYNDHIKAGPKRLDLGSNAWEVANSAVRAINSIPNYSSKRIDVIYNGVRTGATAIHAARGLNFHQGGPMVVNDQKGPLFKELITYPDGTSFVPEGRNVLIPNAPRGTKVLRAALTKKKLPNIKHYKDGVGYSRNETQNIVNGSSTDMSQTNSLLRTLINLIGDGQVIQMDGNEVGRTIYPRIDSTMNSNMQRDLIMNMRGG